MVYTKEHGIRCLQIQIRVLLAFQASLSYFISSLQVLPVHNGDSIAHYCTYCLKLCLSGPHVHQLFS